MARPQSISSEHILDVARRMFVAHGHRCTTAAIAREADVSEGTIFKRFGSKDSLFNEAMALPEFRFADSLPDLVGTGVFRDNVVLLADELIAHFRQLIPMVMRLKSQPGFDPMNLLRNDKSPPIKTLKAVTNFFDAELKLGRMRACDPEVAARMVLGSTHNYVFFESLGVHAAMPIASNTYVRGLIDLLWQGLNPSPSPQDR